VIKFAAMKKIEVSTKNYCPHCQRAKELLRRKGITFIEYDVTDDALLEQEMRERSGHATVPEIFIEDAWVGGCDSLHALEQSGTLDRMLED
jgi:glutaredoxin 3